MKDLSPIFLIGDAPCLPRSTQLVIFLQQDSHPTGPQHTIACLSVAENQESTAGAWRQSLRRPIHRPRCSWLSGPARVNQDWRRVRKSFIVYLRIVAPRNLPHLVSSFFLREVVVGSVVRTEPMEQTFLDQPVDWEGRTNRIHVRNPRLRNHCLPNHRRRSRSAPACTLLDFHHRNHDKHGLPVR